MGAHSSDLNRTIEEVVAQLQQWAEEEEKKSKSLPEDRTEGQKRGYHYAVTRGLLNTEDEAA